MFVDLVEVRVKAGSGGDGIVSFRREKFVNRGGPNGGDGGQGGSVIFVADVNQSSLAPFRHQPLVQAADGQAGGSSNQHGKSAEDVVIKVPVGTCVTNLSTDSILADLSSPKQQLVVAQGGEGGFGNAHFKSSRRRTPLVAEKGAPGQARRIKCELKLVADVGIVGLPNAGKSTFLSVVSNARPEIADYPFTTLTPNLGVADLGDDSLLLADIPGLIEGASTGKGLGHQFLRHAERNRVLLHLVDAYHPNPAKAYQTIRQELASYGQILVQLPEVVAITKTEGLTAGQVNKVLTKLQAVVSPQTPLLAISSQAHLNLKAALQSLKTQLANYQPAAKATVSDKLVFEMTAAERASWQVTAESNYYLVTGLKIERFANKTHFDDYHAITRLEAIMSKLGISHELIRKGYDGSQEIVFGSPEIGRLRAKQTG